MSILSRPHFHDEAAAFRFVEAEIWPEGPVCPHCGGCERISAIKPNPEKKVRGGLKFCGQCRKQFTVKVGTIFEDSHIPMTKWLQAIYLMTASKKGVSAHQLHRTLEITYKSAWFLAHRIREAMASGDLSVFGQARTMVVDDVTAKTIMPIVKANVAKEALLMTDESNVYNSADKHFAGHGTTNQSAGEYRGGLAKLDSGISGFSA